MKTPVKVSEGKREQLNPTQLLQKTAPTADKTFNKSKLQMSMYHVKGQHQQHPR